MPDPRIWPPRTARLEALLKRTGLHIEDHDGVTLWCFKGGAGSVRLDDDEAALLRSIKDGGAGAPDDSGPSHVVTLCAECGRFPAGDTFGASVVCVDCRMALVEQDEMCVDCGFDHDSNASLVRSEHSKETPCGPCLWAYGPAVPPPTTLAKIRADLADPIPVADGLPDYMVKVIVDLNTGRESVSGALEFMFDDEWDPWGYYEDTSREELLNAYVVALGVIREALPAPVGAGSVGGPSHVDGSEHRRDPSWRCVELDPFTAHEAEHGVPAFKLCPGCDLMEEQPPSESPEIGHLVNETGEKSGKSGSGSVGGPSHDTEPCELCGLSGMEGHRSIGSKSFCHDDGPDPTCYTRIAEGLR